MDKSIRDVLKNVAAGRSCEQVLAGDGSQRIRTGPGGTELVGRPNPLGRKEAPLDKAVVHVAPVPSDCDLRKKAEPANQALATVEDAPSEGLRDKPEVARQKRQQFWIDTCREAPEMRVASQQALELYSQHGCRFCVPTPRQVQYILDALDSGLPGWDRDHPELFYHTLELNFPEMLRVCRAHRRG